MLVLEGGGVRDGGCCEAAAAVQRFAACGAGAGADAGAGAGAEEGNVCGGTGAARATGAAVGNLSLKPDLLRSLAAFLSAAFCTASAVFCARFALLRCFLVRFSVGKGCCEDGSLVALAAGFAFGFGAAAAGAGETGAVVGAVGDAAEALSAALFALDMARNACCALYFAHPSSTFFITAACSGSACAVCGAWFTSRPS